MTFTVGLLFEFPSLNGGEYSMLSVLEQLKGTLYFHALAPPSGPLADRLDQLGIPRTGFSVRDPSDRKRPVAELTAELEQLRSTLQLDVLHANSLSMARLSGTLGHTGCCTGHLRDIMRLNQSVIRDLNSNTRLVAVSEAVRTFHQQQGLDSSRCDLIYNGVDSSQFKPCNSTVDGQRLFGNTVSEDDKLLLSVGQICLRKGQLITAQAVCNILQERNDVHLVIAGQRFSEKQESREYEQSLVKTFSDCGKCSHLHMLGYRSDIPELMAASDLLVHAAHQEPFGRVLLEAASSGLPIIATDVGGTAEMLRHGFDAELLPPGDSDALAETINSVLGQHDRAQAYAQSARTRISDQFSVDAASRHLADFWLRLLRQGEPEMGSSGT